MPWDKQDMPDSRQAQDPAFLNWEGEIPSSLLNTRLKYPGEGERLTAGEAASQ